MADRNPHSPTPSGGPPARTSWPASRSRGALSASRSFSGNPAARNRAAGNTAPDRAWGEAAPGPGWREPFVLLVLAAAGFGAAVLLLGAAMAPAASAMF